MGQRPGICFSPSLRYTKSEWKRALSLKTHLFTWMWLVPLSLSLSLSSLDSHLFTLAPGSAMFPWRYKPRDSHMAWDRPEAPDPESLLPELSHLRAWSRNNIELSGFSRIPQKEAMFFQKSWVMLCLHLFKSWVTIRVSLQHIGFTQKKSGIFVSVLSLVAGMWAYSQRTL